MLVQIIGKHTYAGAVDRFALGNRVASQGPIRTSWGVQDWGETQMGSSNLGRFGQPISAGNKFHLTETMFAPFKCPKHKGDELCTSCLYLFVASTQSQQYLQPSIQLSLGWATHWAILRVCGSRGFGGAWYSKWKNKQKKLLYCIHNVYYIYIYIYIRG
jgi:hypothetical protein